MISMRAVLQPLSNRFNLTDELFRFPTQPVRFPQKEDPIGIAVNASISRGTSENRQISALPRGELLDHLLSSCPYRSFEEQPPHRR